MLLTIFIPAYKRPRKLGLLLDDILDKRAVLGFPFEVLVSDDGDADEVEAVVRGFEGRLPIRFFRQKRNLGYSENFFFCQHNARGKYSVYCADDDALEFEGLKAAIGKMERRGNAVAAYAPWLRYDRAADRVVEQFYFQDADKSVPRGNFAGLLQHIINHGIFPEHYIARTSVARRINPRTPEACYWAFVQSAQFLKFGDVLFLKEPYYRSTTRDKKTDEHDPVGTVETESGWDKYRGGLEFLKSVALGQLTEPNRRDIDLAIDSFVRRRMAFALRLRHAENRDPIEIYYLARRVLAHYDESFLPAPFNRIRSAAALKFLATDQVLLRDKLQIQMHGFTDAAVALVAGYAEIPVSAVATAAPADHLLIATAGRADLDVAGFTNCEVVTETDLMGRFL